MACDVQGGYTVNLTWGSATDIYPIDNKLQWPADVPTTPGIYVTMWGDALNYVGQSVNIDQETYGYYNGMLKCCGDEPFDTAELFWATFPIGGSTLSDVERVFIALSYFVDNGIRNTQCTTINVINALTINSPDTPAEPYQLWEPQLANFLNGQPNLTINMT